MLFGVQILILLFGLVMIYLTFLYYKRANYDKAGLIVWFLIWLGFIFLGMFPKTVYGVMEVLAIDRTADFFYAGGMVFFSYGGKAAAGRCITTGEIPTSPL